MATQIIDGYRLVRKDDGIEITRWTFVPFSISVAGVTYFNIPINFDVDDYRIEPLTWTVELPPPTPEQIRVQDFIIDTDYSNLLTQIGSATPAQIKTYVQNNVTDLASARVMLTKVILLLAIIAVKTA